MYIKNLENVTVNSTGNIGLRTFETGATRDIEEGKLDYEGFLSPLVLHCFAQYMHKHRIQADGSLRDSDNWQKGIPRDAYMKSLLRHLHALWYIHRYGEPGETQEEALCAILFNAQGYLHEILIERQGLQERRPKLSPKA